MRNPVKVGIWGGIAAAIGTFVYNAIASLAAALLAAIIFVSVMIVLLAYVVPTIP